MDKPTNTPTETQDPVLITQEALISTWGEWKKLKGVDVDDAELIRDLDGFLAKALSETGSTGDTQTVQNGEAAIESGSPGITQTMQTPQRIVATYDYVDEAGKLLYQSVRYVPKDFRQRRPDGNGGWINNVQGVRRVLYRLPALLAAIKERRTIYVVEGEKDADTLVGRGLVATTNVAGANHWEPEYSKSLHGAARVVIVADKDTKGREHAAKVAAALTGVVGFVGIIELDDCNGQLVKDASDFFEAGGTIEQFQEYADNAVAFKPASDIPAKPKPQDELEREHGLPYFTSDDGTITSINQDYWAGLYAAENIILHEPDENAFYKYTTDTGAYEIETSAAILSKLSKRILDYSRETNAFDLQKKRDAKTLSNVIAHLRGQVEKRGVFTKKRSFIHVANGVIVFTQQGADLKPFSPDFFSRNYSPIAYDPKARCDRFLNELVAPAVHADDVELLQKFAGMFLLGHNRAQRVLLLDGKSGRGKTQLANVMQGLVGEESVMELRTQHLKKQFETYRFLKRTLLVADDVSSDFLEKPGADGIKGLVGGSSLNPEQKGGTGSFTLKGVFNVLIVSNSRLKVRLQGDIDAWRRRLTIVRYEGPDLDPAKKVDDFGAYLLRTEGSGILNWALLGVGKLLRDMPDEGGDFALTDRQRELVYSLLAESESLRHFLKDCVVKQGGQDLTVAEAIEAYAAYCPDRNWQALPITEVENQLPGLMLELFGVVKRHDVDRNGKAQRGFKGVALR